MAIIDLEIASVILRLQSEERSEIILGERFNAFRRSAVNDPDLIVNIHSEKAIIPFQAEKVFDAPLMDETPEGVKNTGEPFWDIWKTGDIIYARAMINNHEREPLLILSRSNKTWHLFSDSSDGVSDQLPYPVDGLLFYFITVMRGGIMIHASAAVNGGRGWVFTGRSGSGKTTLAGIFDRCGDRIIHDDRLILLRGTSGWMIHSTPVYRNDEPRCASLDHMWIIAHGHANVSTPVSGAEAVALIMANCIQQNWDRELTMKHVSAVEDIVSSVRVSRLQFVPDATIRDYLIVRENDDMKRSSHVATALLQESKSIMITAGGYSMWPAIKPGDKVIIEPLGGITPVKGDVVALERDGGFVAHRITEVDTSGGSKMYGTQGDASLKADKLSSMSELKGIVNEIIRSGKRLKVKKKTLPVRFNSISAFIASHLRSNKGLN